VADQPFADRVEPAAVADVVDALAAVVARHLAEPATEIEVFLDLHLGVERDVLRQVAEVLADLLGLVKDVEPVDRRAAAGRRHVAGEDLQRGRLPRAVGAEEADDLPLLYFEADAVDGQRLSVSLGQLSNSNHRAASSAVGEYKCASARNRVPADAECAAAGGK
jgi:hypothetical protein